jgi:His-Xaa-Ser system protein HxsD
VGSTELIFDSRIFSLDAVRNAAYRMADLIDIEIRLDSESIVCSISLVGGSDAGRLEDALQRLRREVIDHDLRIRIREQTEATRNLILAHAFSKTGIIPSE